MFLPTDKRHFNHHTHNKSSNVFHTSTVFSSQTSCCNQQTLTGYTFLLKTSFLTDRKVRSFWVSLTGLTVKNLSNKLPPSLYHSSVT